MGQARTEPTSKWRKLAVIGLISLAVIGVLLIFATYTFFDGSPIWLFVGLALIGLAFAGSVVLPSRSSPGAEPRDDESSSDQADVLEMWWFLRYRKQIYTGGAVFSAGMVVLGLTWAPARPLVPMSLAFGVLYLLLLVAFRRTFGSHDGQLRRRADVSRREQWAWMVMTSAVGLAVLTYLVVLAIRPGPPPAVAVGASSLKPLVLRLSDLPKGWEADQGRSLATTTKAFRAYAHCSNALPPVALAASPVYSFTPPKQTTIYASSNIRVYPTIAEAERIDTPVSHEVARCITSTEERLTGLRVVGNTRMNLAKFSGHRSTYIAQGSKAIQDTVSVRVQRAIVSVSFDSYGSTLPTDMEVRVLETLRARANADASAL